jgi:hypothetical protein
MTKKNTSLQEKLAKDLDVCNWSMLHPHFVRDILFIVDESEDFIKTCLAAAENNTALINTLIEKELLKRPDGYDVEKWQKEKPLFKCLVISPHVFIQLTDINLKK